MCRCEKCEEVIDSQRSAVNRRPETLPMKQLIRTPDSLLKVNFTNEPITPHSTFLTPNYYDSRHHR